MKEHLDHLHLVHKGLFRIDEVGGHSTRGNLTKCDERNIVQMSKIRVFSEITGYIYVNIIMMHVFTHQSTFQSIYVKFSLDKLSFP